MSTQEYEKGTIKVVWITDDGQNKIHSRMFDSETEADRFGRNKRDFIIFKLLQQQDMETFSWELLPYGKYKMYQRVIKWYKMLARVLPFLR